MRAGMGMTAVAVLWVACGGGSGNNAGGGGGGSGAMTASIEGQSFSADQSSSALASTSATVSVYTLTGSHVSGQTYQTLVVSLYNITGPGTYPLGVNSSNFGGIGTFGENQGAWVTPLNGTAGTIIVSSLTSSRIAGTFNFTGSELANPSATRTVSNGAFDLAITGTPGTVQPYQGSTMKATLGGTAWIGATIVVIAKTGGVYSFGGSSQTGGAGLGLSNVSITLSGVTAPGTYQLGPATGSTISATYAGTAYRSNFAGSSGSVVVSSVDANRMKGTFSGTFGSGGASTLTVSNGTFDIGLGP